MTKRTDIHCPSKIEPKDYQFVCFKVPSYALDWICTSTECQKLTDHMVKTGGQWSNHNHGGSCGCCGAHAVYMGIFHHPKTNTYLQVGHICADKLALGYDRAGFNLFRKGIQAQRKLTRGKLKAENILKDANLQAAWDMYKRREDDLANNRPLTWLQDPHGNVMSEHIILDIVGKVIRYGNISDKQKAFVKTLFEKIEKRKEFEAKRAQQKEQWAAERETAGKAPRGRKEFIGEIVSIKGYDTNFGSVHKMLVRGLNGAMVFGSVPGRADNKIKRGDFVKFKATFKANDDDDPKFAYFSRPTNLMVRVNNG